MKEYVVYIHLNKSNNKPYIGITCASNINMRWKHGKGYKACNPHFKQAIQKYGWDGFHHIIYRTQLGEQEAKDLERRLIYLFRADDKRFGYNGTKGGDGCDKGKNCYDADVYREKHKLYARKQRAEHPERFRESSKKYYNNNKEKCKAAQKKWREAHREERREYHNKVAMEWRENNRDKIHEAIRKYKEKFRAEHGMCPEAWRRKQKREALKKGNNT